MGQTTSNFSLEITALYSEHAGWLSRWLNRRTACRDRADELAHDTFCRLLERRVLPQLENPRTYLATIARRLLVDDVRRRHVEDAYLSALALDSDTDPLHAERIFEAVQLLDSLVRLLAGLPEPVREAFLLRRLDGLPNEEIASRLGVSLRTVKRRVAQAYAQCYAFAYPDD